MISVLLLDGLTDGGVQAGDINLSDIADIYIPLFTGIVRYNGLLCETVSSAVLLREYNVSGKQSENIIYAPVFTYSGKNDGISFIYTDSTIQSSVSFRIASILRNERTNDGESVVFVNALHENDALRKFSPVIVDNIRIPSKAENGIRFPDNIYRYALSAARSICSYCKSSFADPAAP